MRRRWAALVVALTFMTGCGDDGDEAERAATGSSSPSTTTSSTAATTSATATTTATTLSSDCSSGTAVPGEVGSADADGDGVIEYFVDLGPRPTERTSSARAVGVAHVVDCRLDVLENPEGKPYELLVGRSGVGESRGFERSVGFGCTDVDGDGRTELVGLDADSSGDETTWTRTIVRLEGGRASNGAVDEGTYTSAQDAAAVDLLSRGTCGEVVVLEPGES